MRIIAHRGNLKGREPDKENTKARADECIRLGIDVEIDIRQDPIMESRLWLGHDNPTDPISLGWLVDREKWLWIHCKDGESLAKCIPLGLNCFYHENDRMTVTSSGWIWHFASTKPAGEKSVLVMPELCSIEKDHTIIRHIAKSVEVWKSSSVFGAVCTDFPLLVRNML